MKDKNVIRKVSEYYSHYIRKDKFFWLFSVSFITLLLIILIPPILGSAFRNLRVGDKITPFTLNDLDGNEVNIEDYKGKLLIFNFFQIDQEKSQKALKALVGMYKEFKEKDVQFIAVTSQVDQIEAVKKFKDENGVDFPILIDGEKTVYQSFGIFVMPVTTLIDKEFKIEYEYSSFMMGFENEVGGRLKVALGEMTQEEYEKSTKQTVIAERSSEEKSAVKKLGQAELLIARGRPDEALKLLEEVVTLDSTIAKAHVLLGDALLKKGKFEEATTEYNKVKEMVKKMSPMAKAADVGLGAVLALTGELDKAQKILSMSAMINPNPISAAKAYYWLGYIAEQKGDLKSAVKHYKKAVEKLLSKAKRGR